MSRSLFDISDDLYALADLLTDAEGEIEGDEAETAIDKWLKELGQERNAKLDAYARLIASMKADAKAIKDEVNRLKERQRIKKAAAERLESRLDSFFKVHGIDSLKTDLFTFKMQKPGGKPKVILNQYYEDFPVDLPEGLRRVKFEPDLVAIRERLEEGDEDIERYASLATPELRLRIK